MEDLMPVRSPDRRWRARSTRFTVGAAAVVALVGACAPGSADIAASPARVVENGIVGDRQEPTTPTRGGTLTMAAYSSVTTLDPTKTPALGSTGGNEMAAVYDVLMRYEPSSGSFLPQMAEALTASPDGQMWTLQLRDGVTFSNGTGVTAQNVMWSIDRYNQANGPGSQLWKANIVSMAASGPRTVTFTLTQPWTEFPAMLAGGHGMIVAPASLEGDRFTPIGAGPFTVERFRPHEELALAARPDYWDGKPHLDTLRFVGLTGDMEKIEALAANDVQVAFVRSSEAVQRARENGYSSYIETVPLGSVAMINNRPGRPGADIRVRRAIAHAIDRNAFDERVDKGTGLPGSVIFPEWSPMHSEVDGLEYDPETASRLLNEAKNDGYDGHLTFLGVAAAKSQTTALAVQSMLQSVGFTVTLDFQSSAGDVTKKLNVEHDYDISYSAIGLPAAAPVNKLTAALNSSSNSNYLGYTNADMDALLSRLRTTGVDSDERRALSGELQTLVNDTVPFVTLGSAPTFTLWADDVHGIEPTTESIMLFGKAWIGA
ncbi:ABC transporter substrate-binding protein [Prescottella sp. R16]|uniref:ABC transporter substrate-binding protein n=1 Tax=Prescottella sp. R16 TaxID=3064529 RepID=UPI00272DF8AD|nr:ABC transporter substrate-binding protein [Prescottella sp. R16]